MSGILLYIIIGLFWCIWQILNNLKGQFNITKVDYIISPYDTMLWYRLEDLNSAECGLFLWCLSIGHIQYLSFCRRLASIILRNRAPIVEKSIQIILMMKNTVNNTCGIYNVKI